MHKHIHFVWALGDRLGLGSSDGIVVRRPAVVGCGWSLFPFPHLHSAVSGLLAGFCGLPNVAMNWSASNGIGGNGK